MLQKIEKWQAAGFFNPLDFALAHTLATIDAKTPDAVLLGSAVASLALSRGNVAWDLSQNPKRLFSEKPQIDNEILAEIAALKAEDFQNQNAVFNVKDSDSASPTPLVFDGKRLYLWQYFQAERRIEKDLLARLNVPKKAVDLDALNVLFTAESDQKTACATAFEENFCVISGGPGTGKTTTVTKLLALILKDAPDSKIALAAPTGKAAQRLKESIDSAISQLPADFSTLFENKNFEPTTIHRLLENRPNGFLYNETRQLPLDVLILDEVSMIDLLLMQSVLKALPTTCKLVLLGDDKQLASVDAGCLLNEICSAENPQIQNAIARLKTSYRFNEKSGIGQFAAAVLNGKSAGEIAQIFNKFKDLALITKEEEFEKIVADFYAENQVEKSEDLDDFAQALLKRATRFQVLCALRKGEFGVAGFNQKMEAIFSKKIGVDRGKSEFFEECPVMMTENIAHLGLNNGDLGVCVLNEEMRLRFVFKENEGLRYFSPERLKNRAEKMFALTVHKSQGSEFQHVVLVLPPKALPILTRELLYTGITRAQKKLTIFIPNTTQPFDLIYKIIQNPFSRQGGLFSCN